MQWHLADPDQPDCGKFCSDHSHGERLHAVVPHRRGIPEEVDGSALPAHSSVIQYHEMVGATDDVPAVMLHGNDRGVAAVTQGVDRCIELGPAVGVEFGGGLVEAEHLGLQGEDPRDGHPLPLPTGELRCVPCLVSGQSDGGKTVAGAALDVGTRHPVVARPERHVLRDGAAEQLGVGVLQHQPHEFGDRLHPEAGEIGAVQLHAAVERPGLEVWDHAVERHQQGRLAGPRGAHHDGETPPRKAEVDGLQRPGVSLRVGVADADGVEGVLHQLNRAACWCARRGRRRLRVRG